MADLTLPGTISGLLRRCSCIVVTGGRYAGRRGILAEDPDGCPRVLVLLDASGGDDVVLEVLDVSDIALDLSDSTGLVHAFWWLVALPDKVVSDTLEALGLDRPEFGDLLSRVFTGMELTDAERAEFRRACLQVAGVPDAG